MDNSSQNHYSGWKITAFSLLFHLHLLVIICVKRYKYGTHLHYFLQKLWKLYFATSNVSYFHLFISSYCIIKSVMQEALIWKYQNTGYGAISFFSYYSLAATHTPFLLQDIKQNRCFNIHIQSGHKKYISELAHFKQSFPGSSCFVVTMFCFLPTYPF